MKRHYPPIAIFHAPDCLNLGGNGTALPVDLAREDYPHHRNCPCIAANFGITPFVIVEQGGDTDHLYRPSPQRPADAARSLCKACKGTHGNVDQERERIEVKLVPVVAEGGAVMNGDPVTVRSATDELLGEIETVTIEGQTRYRSWKPIKPHSKTAASRYPSVHQTAEDARRYLTSESPTSAPNPGCWERW